VAEAAVRQAEAQRDSAQSLLDRERPRDPLVRRDIEIKILENQLRSAGFAIEAAQFKVKQAKQTVAHAELGLKLTVVRAPVLRPAEGSSAAESRPGVGGVTEEPRNAERRKFLVLDRRVSLNQMIGPPLSGHLFTLAGDLSVMHVEAQVAEGDFPRVTRGLPVEFTVPGGEDEDLVLQGKVEDVRLLPASDRGAVFYKVIVEVRNDRDSATGRWKLTPGQTATVEVLRRTHERVWKMPATALSFQPEDDQTSPAAREKLARWDARKDREDWKPVWLVGEGKPWPLFVRTGSVGARGETGIRDLSFSEVLEWDPELKQKPDPNNPATWPQVIIGAQAVKGGLFSTNIKF
jgi:multidrug efflux pump subunit AcrA (membrane-fusion protein)